MNSALFLAASATLSMAGMVQAQTPVPQPPASQSRPNILWIVCEDMSPNLGCYGDAYSTSPNLDQLANEGTRYTNVFAAAPVCSPSRTSLLFGRYGTSLGSNNHRSDPIVDADKFRGYAAFLKDAGYYTTNHKKTDYNLKASNKTVKDCWSGDGTWRDRPDKSQPFMSVINIETTHQSNTSVIPYEQFVKKIQSQLKPGQIHDPANAPLAPFLPDTPEIRKGVARYYDCISRMDAEAGEILADLKADGLDQNTIVFFYSDHGAGQPRAKTTALDSGLLTPLIVRVPESMRSSVGAADAGTVDDRLTSFTDFGPTVLSIAGVKTPDTMTGKPFLGAFKTEPAKYVFGSRDRLDETIDAQRTVSDGHYRYVHQFMPHLPTFQHHGYFAKGPIYAELYKLREEHKLTGLAEQTFGSGPRAVEAFYDSDKDPSETNNLINDPAYKSKIDEMRAALKDWMINTPDLNLIPEPMLNARGDGKPLTGLIPPLDMKRIVETAWMNTAESPSELIERSNDAEAIVRFWAVMALRQQKADDAVKAALTARLEDQEPLVRAQAASNLLAIDSSNPAATAALKAVAGSKDEEVAKYGQRLVRGPY